MIEYFSNLSSSEHREELPPQQPQLDRHWCVFGKSAQGLLVGCGMSCGRMIWKIGARRYIHPIFIPSNVTSRLRCFEILVLPERQRF
jgi:hypothetical protein